jgi:hypothetical protein
LAGTVPGKLVIGWMQGVEFKMRHSGLGSGDRFQGLDTFKQVRALERGNQAAVILLFGLYRDDLAFAPGPVGKTEREKSDICRRRR